jgi:hypothetical protein
MVRFVEWTVRMSDRDAPLSEFLKGSTAEIVLSRRIAALKGLLVQSKDYASHQGATVTPRPFWVVEVRTAARRTAQGSEEVVPLIEEESVRVRSSKRATLVQGQGKRKQAWRGISLEGDAPPHFLFGLLTSRYVGCFSILHRDLCLLPATIGNGGLTVINDHWAAHPRQQRTLEKEGNDERMVRDWVRQAQARWKAGRQADQQELCTERLNYNGGLSSQPATAPRVVHTRSGSFYAALLRPSAQTSTGVPLNELRVRFRRDGTVVSTAERPLAGVVVDNLLHWIQVGSVQEGYWLVGVLNSEPFVSRLLKEVQNRDYYSAPSRLLLSLGLKFDHTNPTCAAISDAAKLIESRKTVFDRELLSQELGKEALQSVDDTDVSPAVPRLKWSFQELCRSDRECALAFSRINSLVTKSIK